MIRQWLAFENVGWKVVGSNPNNIVGFFSPDPGSFPELGVPWAQWVGTTQLRFIYFRDHTFEDIALITWWTSQVMQFPGLLTSGINQSVRMVCHPVKISYLLFSYTVLHQIWSVIRPMVIHCCLSQAIHSWWPVSACLPPSSSGVLLVKLEVFNISQSQQRLLRGINGWMQWSALS